MVETVVETESREGYPLAVAPAAPVHAPRSNRWLQAFPGVVLCFAVAALAERAAAQLPMRGNAISALPLSLLFGVLLGNIAPQRVDALSSGVGLTKKHLLRAAIVLYGFRLTVQDFGSAGWAVLAVDVLVLASTFALAVWVGVKLLKLDFETAVLVGAGSSICGASAILATAPMVRASPEQACMAVGTVAVFGTAAFLVYPLLHELVMSQWPGFIQDKAFGIYIGSTVHDVAQVIATASASGPLTQGPAVVAKMGRVALLAPFLVGFAFCAHRSPAKTEICRPSAPMPWFPALFAVAVLVNSVAPVSFFRPAITTVDGWVLAAAMAALGLTTRVAAVRAAGPRPLVLAAALFFWLVVGGALINVAASLLG